MLNIVEGSGCCGRVSLCIHVHHAQSSRSRQPVPWSGYTRQG
ncbi:hypothetical protein HMPREF9057_01993 [Actinomyces sp. oral taxon 171 str. F0337]|nr:hypothetical protein HMPREF9057_01993 [Actinomyces sp. oral taxon 171 str. F0337]